MSALISEDRKVDAVVVPAASFFARIIRWYRDAVSEPATEGEQAEWQQNSF